MIYAYNLYNTNNCFQNDCKKNLQAHVFDSENVANESQDQQTGIPGLGLTYLYKK